MREGITQGLHRDPIDVVSQNRVEIPLRSLHPDIEGCGAFRGHLRSRLPQGESTSISRAKRCSLTPDLEVDSYVRSVLRQCRPIHHLNASGGSISVESCLKYFWVDTEDRRCSRSLGSVWKNSKSSRAPR